MEFVHFNSSSKVKYMMPFRLKIKPLGILCLTAIGLSSCYMNLNKHLEREVKVRLDTNFPVSIDNQGNSSFSSSLNEVQYKEEFLKGLRAEFQGSKIIIDDLHPEFEIQFSQFSVSESTRMDTIKNTSSPDNGKIFELSKLRIEARGKLIRMTDGVVNDWYAHLDDSESTTSLRSASQITGGTNKEKNEYREKPFNTDQAGEMTLKVGRRSGVSIVKEIYNSLN
jgi:hypothetical protein